MNINYDKFIIKKIECGNPIERIKISPDNSLLIAGDVDAWIKNMQEHLHFFKKSLYTEVKLLYYNNSLSLNIKILTKIIKSFKKMKQIKKISTELLEFYRKYPIDHWIYKAIILKNIIDNYDSVKELLLKDLKDIVDEDCINMLKAEIHFTYFKNLKSLE